MAVPLLIVQQHVTKRTVEIVRSAGAVPVHEQAGKEHKEPLVLAELVNQADDGRPVALAASAGEGRHPAMAQEEALAFVRDRFRPGRSLDAHILETIREPSKREVLIEEMMARAVAPQVPHFEKELP